MDNDYGWLKQLMMRGMYQPTNRSMPGMLAQTPIGGGANAADAAMAQKLGAPVMKSNPSAVLQPQQQQQPQQQPGFMANGLAGIRRMIEAGPIGRPVLQAGDDAYQDFHGPGPSEL